jgi:(p)ppGpp synthase/HD superfamily hydrolase
MDARMIVEAVLFAADAHAHMRRDDGKTPYFNHLAEVAAHCARHEPFDPVLVVAAYLHDTLEDTGATEPLLRERFGDEVAGVVMEVTDPPGLKGKARRQRQVEHAATSSLRARLIKIADKTSNVAELVEHPGKDETIAGMQKYLKWARAVVDACRGTDAGLELAFDTAAARLDTVIAAHAGRKD